jgi:hypothetical protein
MGYLKGILAVPFNFPLQNFTLYITLKGGLSLMVSLLLRYRGGFANASDSQSFGYE